jgi:TonB family protein
MGLLYLVYALFLRKDTFFSINRFYLAGSLAFSAIMPLLRFGDLAQATIPEYSYLLETIMITPSGISGVVSSHMGIFQVLIVAYVTGAAIFLVRFLVQLGQLGLLIRKYGVTRSEGLRLVLIHREYSPFSFFNLIFINSRDYQPGQLHEIIEHEKVHIRQGHTLDLFMLEIMTILQWFNPFIWMYRRSLKGIHEFLADEGVLLKGTRISEYQQRLLNQALGIQLNDLTNNFNQSLLKRRFIMMTKRRSGLLARLKPLLALPVVILMAMAFSITGGNSAIAQDTQKKADVKAATPASTQEEDGKVFQEVAKMPEFRGGQDALVQYVVSNVKYPEEAKKKGVTGKVFVQFIVDKNGKVKDAKVLRAVDPELDAEALRVIATMPDWTPGLNEKGNPVNVAVTLPIQFSLDGKSSDKEEKK